jgi:hypothetical protein
MDIRKTFSDHGYEIEAREDFQKQKELTIRKDGAQLQVMKLPRGYDLESFAAGILDLPDWRRPKSRGCRTRRVVVAEFL